MGIIHRYHHQWLICSKTDFSWTVPSTFSYPIPLSSVIYNFSSTLYLLLQLHLLSLIFPLFSYFCIQFLFNMWPILFAPSILTHIKILLSSFILISISSFIVFPFQLIYVFSLPQPHFKVFQILFFSLCNRVCFWCLHYNAPYKRFVQTSHQSPLVINKFLTLLHDILQLYCSMLCFINSNALYTAILLLIFLVQVLFYVIVLVRYLNESTSCNF